jgi:hypothetical protein
LTINPIINIIIYRGMKHSDVTYTSTIPLAGLINKDKPFAGRYSGRLHSLPLLPFEYEITAARFPGDLESMPLFSSVSRCKAFSFQGCSILLLPCFTAVAALRLWCPVSDLGRLPLKKRAGCRSGCRQRSSSDLCRCCRL